MLELTSWQEEAFPCIILPPYNGTKIARIVVCVRRRVAALVAVRPWGRDGQWAEHVGR